MRYIISISLSVLLLLQTLNFGAKDVLRIGELIEHAQLHSEEYGDSFFNFLTKHYGSSKKDHFASHDGHDKLPFNHDSGPKSTVSIYVFEPEEVLVIPFFFPTHPPLNFFYTNSYSSLSDQDIFQPPKHA